MPGALHHRLYAGRPCPIYELPEGQQLLDLGPIRSIRQTPGTQPISQAQHPIVRLRHLQQPIVLLVQGILPSVMFHPSDQKRAPPAHHVGNASLPVQPVHRRERHAAVHRDEIYAVLQVRLNGREQVVLRHIHDRLTLTGHPDRGLVDRHGAHRNRGVLHHHPADLR